MASGSVSSLSTDCQICLGPLQQPVRSSCCGQTFCSSCTQALQPPDRCPYCRTGQVFFCAVQLRPPPRQAKPQDKKYRGEQPREHPREHSPEPTRGNYTLPPRPFRPSRYQPQPRQQPARPPDYRCLATGCNFSSASGLRFLTHLVNVHGDHVLAHHHMMFQNPQVNQPQHDNNGYNRQEVDIVEQIDRFQPQEQNHAKLGTNRKTYCGEQLNGPACACCNGICGPNDGCNCERCMTLDIINFGISQGNSLVNKYGRVASRSSETGMFYCAALLDVSDTDTDMMTYCGPLDGPNCEACAALDLQSQNRYASLMMYE